MPKTQTKADKILVAFQKAHPKPMRILHAELKNGQWIVQDLLNEINWIVTETEDGDRYTFRQTANGNGAKP